MAYIDALYDRQKDKILVAERVNGERHLLEYDADHVFYYSHPQGSHTSIYGDSCRMFATNSNQKFKKELARIVSPVSNKKPVTIFESDIRPEFRSLAKHYMGVDAPVLNVGFFDIEVDFDPAHGFAPVHDPFNKITAISVYISSEQRMITLALRPHTISIEDAQRACDAFSDTILFNDEKELLKAFLEIIEDVDVLSGWNCVPKTTNVWLVDRITKLVNIERGDITACDGAVIDFKDTGNKRSNKITLENGQFIGASDEHVIPILVKQPNEHKYHSSLESSRQNRTVGEIKNILASGGQVYLETKLRENTNFDYTIRQYLDDFLPDLLAFDYFDIAIVDESLRDKALSTLSAEVRNHMFPYTRLISSFRDYPRVWKSKNYQIDAASLKLQLNNSKNVTFVFEKNRTFTLELDRVIEPEVLQLMGLLFADGTFNRSENSFTLYGSKKEQMEWYKDIVLKEPHISSAVKDLKIGKDGCYTLDVRRSSIFGIFVPMVYKNGFLKNINVEILSRLSSKQFSAFYSGLIDGDGWITDSSVILCNFESQLPKIQELLAWNGVYSTCGENQVHINATDISCGFLNSLTLFHPTRALRLKKITISKQSNSPSKFFKKFVFNTHAYVRVKSIVDGGEVAMSDIQTENGYFSANGIRVHNSTFFDIPYIVNRITRMMGGDSTRDLCLWGQKPRERKLIKFKKEHQTYDLVGRVHLDYLELYQKHNPQQLHSYRLDYVGEIEVGENKTVYEGTLDDLYKKDFKRFIEYNRQDTMLLVKIDAKKKFIELANQVAHNNCVTLKTTMGSVALVEQAIINEMHQMGFVVPNRKKKLFEESSEDDDEDEDEDERTPVVGAYVADPKKGLHDDIGCVDINSLYPSTIRALNMSPETIIGQVRLDETMDLISKRILGGTKRAEAWEGIFASLAVDHMHAHDGAPITIDFEDGTVKTMSGRDLYDYVFNPKNNVCITANGTLFRTDKDGIIPLLLAKWYSERQEMQDKQKSFETLADSETDPDKKKEHLYWAGFWNQRQQARKILLNSLYGALLNEGLRFYDERLGQSVTLTGRSIVRHMNSKINEIITGLYDYKGDAIYYSDTDSSYFSAYQVLKNDPRYADFEWSRENIISLYQGIEQIVNDSFPEFMKKNFNTTLQRGAIIKAGLELVASKSLFIKKKKYAVLMYYKDGKRLDLNGKPGKLKAMGLDLKRADTPKFMQSFLEKLLMELLTGAEKESMFELIRAFRREFTTRPGWEKGTPKKVNALTDYVQKHASARGLTLQDTLKLKSGFKIKVNMPGHVRAAMNWNHLCESNGDRYSMRIGDGAKIIVCKLKPNLMKIDSVAYPIDEPHIPEWFKSLNFDHSEMEEKIIDNKLTNLVGVLGWDLSQTKERPDDEFFVFGR